MRYMNEYGSFYEVKGGTLFYAIAIATEPPVPDMDTYGEVTAVDTVSEEHGKQFLKEINQHFDTDFKLDDFDGR